MDRHEWTCPDGVGSIDVAGDSVHLHITDADSMIGHMLTPEQALEVGAALTRAAYEAKPSLRVPNAPGLWWRDDTEGHPVTVHDTGTSLGLAWNLSWAGLHGIVEDDGHWRGSCHIPEV